MSFGGPLKVYTRTGDDGTTGLFYGGRTAKDSIGPDCYGTLDEAVAAMGLARAHLDADHALAPLVIRLQREAFVAGAELATAPDNRHKLTDGSTRVTVAMVEALERDIDALTEQMTMPEEFVLPGQHPSGAAFDLARTIVRRAERLCVTATASGWLGSDSQVIPYINRLADLLWVMSRVVEETWIPRRQSSPTKKEY